MQVSVSEAKAQLTELVRRAEAGEEVGLTRHGRLVARIVPEPARRDRDELLRAMEEISRRGAAKALPGPCAARSADFLYDENGMPA